MRVGEAKDFLVQQTAEQAQREGIALSDLEKRMMYFTEGPDASEDPTTLNEEFEAQHDTTEYETKIARLMAHAYRRLKKENPETARTWNTAIRELRKGDHYILVMWSSLSSATSALWGFWKTMGASLILVVIMGILVFVFSAVSDHYRVHWNSATRTHSFLPTWLQRVALALVLGGYIYSLLPASVVKQPSDLIGQSLAKLWRFKSKDAAGR
jgi:hypothetical protein